MSKEIDVLLSLNPSTYVTSGTSGGKLETNFADISLEAGQRLMHERVNFFKLQIDGNKVINPELGPEDVSCFYSTENELTARETRAGMAIRQVLLEEPEHTLVIWFSPKNEEYKYKESRITVGYKVVNDKGVKEMQSYGIPTDHSPEELLHIAWMLNEFCNEKNKLDNPEELRACPLIIHLPEAENPWDFLHEMVPLEEVWESIRSGEAKKIREEVTKVAREVAPQVQMLLQAAHTPLQRIEAIRYGEKLMSERGFSIDYSKLTCLVSIATSEFSYTSFGPNNTLHKGEKKFVRNCGVCGKKINAEIESGYKCTCGGMYEGC
jgi:hypothetical protein